MHYTQAALALSLLASVNFTAALISDENSSIGSGGGSDGRLVAKSLADLPGFPLFPRGSAASATVSGVSAGGYMAVQVHISHSSVIQGAAIFAAGPFYCAEGTLEFAETKCMDGTQGGPNTQYLVDLTISDAAYGYIDDTAYLKDDRVYLFSGTEDTVVDSSVVRELQNYYEHFVSAGAAGVLETSFSVPAEHCMPTVDYGEPCDELGSPYLGQCDFDGAFAALQALGLISPSSNSTTKNSRSDHLSSSSRIDADDNLFYFSQLSYLPEGWTSHSSSIGETGAVYIPTACQQQLQDCALHISFHGCYQAEEFIGFEYAQHAGFNQWAELNNIVVLYPYARASKELPLNPNGCFDWWGYTGSLYGVQEGVQVRFVKNLIDAFYTA